MWFRPNGEYILVMTGFGSLGGDRLMCERYYYVFWRSTGIPVRSRINRDILHRCMYYYIESVN